MVLLELLELLATPAKMENPDQLVPQVIPVKMARTVTLVDLVQLDLQDQLDILVNPEHLDTQELKDWTELLEAPDQPAIPEKMEHQE